MILIQKQNSEENGFHIALIQFGKCLGLMITKWTNAYGIVHNFS